MDRSGEFHGAAGAQRRIISLAAHVGQAARQAWGLVLVSNSHLTRIGRWHAASARGVDVSHAPSARREAGGSREFSQTARMLRRMVGGARGAGGHEKTRSQRGGGPQQKGQGRVFRKSLENIGLGCGSVHRTVTGFVTSPGPRACRTSRSCCHCCEGRTLAYRQRNREGPPSRRPDRARSTGPGSQTSLTWTGWGPGGVGVAAGSRSTGREFGRLRGAQPEICAPGRKRRCQPCSGRVGRGQLLAEDNYPFPALEHPVLPADAGRPPRPRFARVIGRCPVFRGLSRVIRFRGLCLNKAVGSVSAGAKFARQTALLLRSLVPRHNLVNNPSLAVLGRSHGPDAPPQLLHTH